MKPGMAKTKRILPLLFVLLSAATLAAVYDFYNGVDEIVPSDDIIHRYVFLAPNQKEHYWSAIASGVKDADRDLGTDTLLVEYEGNENIRTYFIDALFSEADGVIMKGTSYINDEIRSALSEQGIPTVFYNSDDPDSGRIGYVGVDNYAVGERVSSVLTDKFPDGAKILVILRSKSAYSQQARVEVLDKLQTRAGFEIVEYIEDQGDPVILKDALLDAVTHYSDLDVIVCMEEIASEYLGNLLFENSMDPNDYFIISTDYSEQTINYVEEGTYDMVLMQNMQQIGYQAVALLEQYLNETDRSDWNEIIPIEVITITADNVKEYRENGETDYYEWNSY